MSVTYNPSVSATPYTYRYTGSYNFDITLTAAENHSITLIEPYIIPVLPAGWTSSVGYPDSQTTKITITSPNPLTETRVLADVQFLYLLDGRPDATQQYTLIFPALVYNPDTAIVGFTEPLGILSSFDINIKTVDPGYVLEFKSAQPDPKLGMNTFNITNNDTQSLTITTSGTPANLGEFYIQYSTLYKGVTSFGSSIVNNIAKVTVEATCLDRSTFVLMADGTEKPIYEIKRGDLVASGINDDIFRVAKLCINSINPDEELNLVVFNEGIIGANRKLIITHNHSILYQNYRRYASKFNLPGVEIHKTNVSNILTPDENGKYALYDLQFETVGSYVANGIVVQSRSPRSFLTPLSKEEYFDTELYRPDLMNDLDPAYEYPLVFDLLN